MLIYGITSSGFDLTLNYKFKVCFGLFPLRYHSRARGQQLTAGVRVQQSVGDRVQRSELLLPVIVVPTLACSGGAVPLSPIHLVGLSVTPDLAAPGIACATLVLCHATVEAHQYHAALGAASAASAAPAKKIRSLLKVRSGLLKISGGTMQQLQ